MSGRLTAPDRSPSRQGSTEHPSSAESTSQASLEPKARKKTRSRIRRTCQQCRESHRLCDRGLPACGQCLKSGKRNLCSYSVEPDLFTAQEAERLPPAIILHEDRYGRQLYAPGLLSDGRRQPVDDPAGQLARLSVSPPRPGDLSPVRYESPLVHEVVDALRVELAQSQVDSEKLQGLAWSFGDSLITGETSMAVIISRLPSPAQLAMISSVYFSTSHTLDLYMDKAAVQEVIHMICIGRSPEVSPHSLALVFALCGNVTTQIVSPGQLQCMTTDATAFYALACSWVRLSIRCLVVSGGFDSPTLDAVRALALVGTYSFAEGARNNLVLLERALSTAIRLGIHNESYSVGRSSTEAEFGRRVWWKVCATVRVGDEFSGKLPKMVCKTARLPTPGALGDLLEPGLTPNEILLRARCEITRLEHDLAVLLEVGCDLEEIDELETRLQDIVSSLDANGLGPASRPAEFYGNSDRIQGYLIPHAVAAARIFYVGVRLHRPFIGLHENASHCQALFSYASRLIDLYRHYPIDIGRSSILAWNGASVFIALLYACLESPAADNLREEVYTSADGIYALLEPTTASSTVMRSCMVVVRELVRRVTEARLSEDLVTTEDGRLAVGTGPTRTSRSPSASDVLAEAPYGVGRLRNALPVRQAGHSVAAALPQHHLTYAGPAAWSSHWSASSFEPVASGSGAHVAQPAGSTQSGSIRPNAIGQPDRLMPSGLTQASDEALHPGWLHSRDWDQPSTHADPATWSTAHAAHAWTINPAPYHLTAAHPQQQEHSSYTGSQDSHLPQYPPHRPM